MRLAATNLKRNRTFYLPYAIATAMMSAMFFIVINTVVSQNISNIHYGSTLSAMLIIGCIVMALFTFGYMFYLNSFLIKRRRREFGLYGILGLEKRHVSRVIFLENTMLGGASLAIGLIAGTVFGRLMFMVLGALLRYGSGSVFRLSAQAYITTAAFFALVFVTTTLYNQRVVRRADPVDLLNGEAHGEKRLWGTIPLGILGFMCLAGAYWFSMTINVTGLAIVYFWPAVALVIIGVNLVFRSGSQLVLAALKKNDNIYYKPQGFITISGLQHRLKQNAAGLANICILCTMVLVTISTCSSLYFGQEKILTNRFPNDYRLEMTADKHAARVDLSSIKQEAEALAQKYGVTLDDIYTYRCLQDQAILYNGEFTFKDTNAALVGEERDGVTFYNGLTNIYIIALEDYNELTNSHEALAGDEVLILSDEELPMSFIDANGAKYRVKKTLCDTRLTSGSNSGLRDVFFVARDWSAVDALRNSINPGLAVDRMYGENNCQYVVVANYSGDTESCVAMCDELTEKTTGGFGGAIGMKSYDALSIDVARENSYGMYGGLFFMGILFALLFLTNTVVIMYFKQVDEGFEDRSRFVIMQKVGMSDDEVRSTINRQVLLVFMLPLAVALINILAASNLLVQLISAFAMTSLSTALMCIAITTVIFAAVYAVVFRSTAKTYYRLVKW